MQANEAKNSRLHEGSQCEADFKQAVARKKWEVAEREHLFKTRNSIQGSLSRLHNLEEVLGNKVSPS